MREMMIEQTITITAEDQRAVRRAYFVQSRVGLVIGLFALFFPAGLLLTLDAHGLLLTVLSLLVVFAAVLLAVVTFSVVTQSRAVRRRLPLGSSLTLVVGDRSLGYSGVDGSSQIRWHRLSNLRRVGDAVCFIAVSWPIPFTLPGRVLSDQAFGLFAARISEFRDEPTQQDRIPLDLHEGVALIRSGTLTGADQTALRTGILRQLTAFYVFTGALALVTLVVAVLTIAGTLPLLFLGVLLSILVLSITAVVQSVRGSRKNIQGSFPLGAWYTVIVSEDSLHVTGQHGASRLPWGRLSGVERVGELVRFTSGPPKTMLLVPSRFVSDEMLAVMTDRISTAADPTIRR